MQDQSLLVKLGDLTNTYTALLWSAYQQIGPYACFDTRGACASNFGFCCRMVDAGEIFAEIDASAGMVRFLEDPEQFTSPAAIDRLNSTIQACSAVAQKLQALNTQVSLAYSIARLILSSTQTQSICLQLDTGVPKLAVPALLHASQCPCTPLLLLTGLPTNHA